MTFNMNGDNSGQMNSFPTGLVLRPVHKLKSSYYSKSDYRKPQDDYRNHTDSSAEPELYQGNVKFY